MPRKKPGHPVTTGMATTRPVHYRLSSAERQDIDSVAEAQGTTANLFSKRVTIAAVKRAKKQVNNGDAD